MTRAVRPRPDPVISVVMPVYNGAALLPATLDSLAAQSFTDFEVIVVDDCSTDATRACVAGWSDPRVRLVAMPVNGGPVLARNAGVAAARGRYIAALDADDLCRPDRFARQVAYLKATCSWTASSGRPSMPRLPRRCSSTG
jgi:glycosyltransferase involved in cell wall biosynthesis